MDFELDLLKLLLLCFLVTFAIALFVLFHHALKQEFDSDRARVRQRTEENQAHVERMRQEANEFDTAMDEAIATIEEFRNRLAVYREPEEEVIVLDGREVVVRWDDAPGLEWYHDEATAVVE